MIYRHCLLLCRCFVKKPIFGHCLNRDACIFRLHTNPKSRLNTACTRHRSGFSDSCPIVQQNNQRPDVDFKMSLQSHCSVKVLKFIRSNIESETNLRKIAWQHFRIIFKREKLSVAVDTRGIFLATAWCISFPMHHTY